MLFHAYKKIELEKKAGERYRCLYTGSIAGWDGRKAEEAEYEGRARKLEKEIHVQTY